MWCGGSPGRSDLACQRSTSGECHYGQVRATVRAEYTCNSGSPLPPLWSLGADFVSISVSKNGDTITTQAGPFCLYRSITLLFSLATVLIAERSWVHKRTAVGPPSHLHARAQVAPIFPALTTPLLPSSSLHWHGRCSRLRHPGIRWRLPTPPRPPQRVFPVHCSESDPG